jgi:hypothetical protein
MRTQCSEFPRAGQRLKARDERDWRETGGKGGAIQKFEVRGSKLGEPFVWFVSFVWLVWLVSLAAFAGRLSRLWP